MQNPIKMKYDHKDSFVQIIYADGKVHAWGDITTVTGGRRAISRYAKMFDLKVSHYVEHSIAE